MSFFKSIWKNNSKHKKLNEELALASSIRDYAESPLDLHDEEITDDAILYNLKYIGSAALTPAATEDNTKKLKFKRQSSVMTSGAIKKIISTSKSLKKLPDVSLSISPKGIETFDSITGDTMLQVPIYKISYCSIDAAHENVFAFVSSTSDKEQSFDTKNTQQFGSPESPAGQLESSSLDDEEGLVCHAFQCQKRKIAHNVTMTVARSFERAYQIWQNQEFLDEIRNKDPKKANKENIINQQNTANIKQIIMEQDPKDSIDSSCLIDLGSEDGPKLNCLYSKDHRDFLQTTWVAFE
ncbi:unnamed protein product [Diamesa tonsa]